MDKARFDSISKDVLRHLRVCERRLKEAKENLGRTQLVREAIDGLSRSWKDHDPGKYHPHWFFVKDFTFTGVDERGLRLVDRCSKIWIRELIDPAKLASFHTAHVPFGSVNEIKQQECPQCTILSNLVGSYRQTHDSPTGDEWRLDIYLLCETDMALYPIGYHEEGGRFSY